MGISKEVLEQIAKKIEESGLSKIGVRAMTRAKNAPKVGDILDNSYTWEDGIPTDEMLEGTSALIVKWDDNWTIDRADLLKKLNKSEKEYASEANHIAIVGSNNPNSYEGNDIDEIVMPDAEVLHFYEVPGKGGKTLPVAAGAYAGLAGVASGPRDAMAYSNAMLRQSQTPEWQATTAPGASMIHGIGSKLMDIQLPGNIRPFEGIGDYLINYGYDDPYSEKLKRAFWAGMDLL